MKDNHLLWIVLVIVALIIGIVIGNMISPQPQEHVTQSEEDHGHSHDLPHTHDETHSHSMLEVPALNAPTVDLVIHDDPKSGWNLELVTENFEFTPEDASLEHEPGTGHAHLYIDGDKITRLYGEWYHIPELAFGEHEISVTLSTNDHDDYAVEGIIIGDSEIIVV